MFEQYYTERIGVESNGEFVSNGGFIMHSNIQLRSGVCSSILKYTGPRSGCFLAMMVTFENG